MPYLSSAFLPNESRECLHLGRGQITLLVLRVEVEHIERVARRIPVVDQALSASLSPSLCRPAQLPQPTPAWNDRTLLGAEDES